VAKAPTATRRVLEGKNRPNWSMHARTLRGPAEGELCRRNPSTPRTFTQRRFSPCHLQGLHGALEALLVVHGVSELHAASARISARCDQNVHLRLGLLWLNLTQ
jgi:hypothetical protein